MPGRHYRCAAAAGELVGFGWSTSKPFLHYFVLDAGGGVQLDVPVDVGQSTFMHDFAITKVGAAHGSADARRRTAGLQDLQAEESMRREGLSAPLQPWRW